MTEFVVAMLWSAVEVLVVFTGAQVVRVVRLGRWRTVPRGNDEARVVGAAGALSFRREGQRVVTADGSMWMGLLFCALLVCVVVALSRAVSA